MKVLMFTISHGHLEDLMAHRALARIYRLEDLGHERDHYVITALVRDQYVDEVMEKSADHPRWVKWP